MISANHGQTAGLHQLTKRAVRSFWLDGLWDLAIAGMLLIIGIWGMVYIQFVAFPNWTWPFGHKMGREVVWLGLLILISALVLYIWIAWIIVKKLKRVFVSPYVGYAEHRFFLPVDPKVYVWYLILYLLGLGLAYGLFSWIKGGFSVMSVPLIISPAAILWVVGRIYAIRRYQILAVFGLVLALTLELFLTTTANYIDGPSSFLDVLPQWGSPALPSLIWAAVFTLSGLYAFIGVRRLPGES